MKKLVVGRREGGQSWGRGVESIRRLLTKPLFSGVECILDKKSDRKREERGRKKKNLIQERKSIIPNLR